MSYEDICQREYELYLQGVRIENGDLCPRRMNGCARVGVSSIGSGPDGPLGQIYLSVCCDRYADLVRENLKEKKTRAIIVVRGNECGLTEEKEQLLDEETVGV
ncbi:MAG: hypothetical protein KAS32_06835 [Candidatus Peribacteraceae bacterium]|nr:hypothetical protein [Candidatus Peribacteraceae bacterium]